MRFYGQDDDEHEDEMEEFFDEEGNEELEDMLNEDFRELKIAELNLVEFDLKQRLLQDSLAMCENTFLWKFLPHQTKLDRLAETYLVLSKLVSQV